VKIVAADVGGEGADSGNNLLFAELVAVHSLIRRDLDVVEVLARDAAGLAPPAALRERLGELKTSTMLWQLKYGCINYCRFVHATTASGRGHLPARPLVDALSQLRELLLAHLDFEEQSLESPLSRMKTWAG
jgi:hypothetical protein